MEYVTFVSRRQTWRLYRGVGSGGTLLAERRDALPVHDLSAVQPPILWVCCQLNDGQETVIQRLTLPDLGSSSLTWSGGRLGALATASDGQQVVVLELPDEPNELPRLWRWNASEWHAVEAQVIPDISSRLAWLDGARLVYESIERRLIILDFDTGKLEIGPAGCCPAAAGDKREWYAIQDGKVLRFPFEQSFLNTPTTLDDFSFGFVTTLRITRDGEVCTWTEPRFIHESRGYFQKRGQRRHRFRDIDEGIGAVLGSYTWL